MKTLNNYVTEKLQVANKEIKDKNSEVWDKLQLTTVDMLIKYDEDWSLDELEKYVDGDKELSEDDYDDLVKYISDYMEEENVHDTKIEKILDKYNSNDLNKKDLEQLKLTILRGMSYRVADA